jgi:hypothetical protein
LKKIKPSEIEASVVERWVYRFEELFKKRPYGTLKDKEKKNKIRKL